MSRRIFAAAIAVVVWTPAHADKFVYSCEIDGKTYPLTLDDALHALAWRGKTYKVTDPMAGDQDGCPRFGWRATRSEETFSICTATKGVADFTQSDGTEVQCKQKQLVTSKRAEMNDCLQRREWVL